MSLGAFLLSSGPKKSLRELFDEKTEAAKKRLIGKLYDAHPEDEFHEERDEYWAQIVTRGPDGKFMVERLKLRWPLAMTDMKSEAARRRLLVEFVEAFFRLRDRKVGAARPERRVGDRRRGQSLVEFALMMPVLLFTILGFTEAAFLLAEKAHQDRATFTVAEWSASHPGEPWNAIAAELLPGCDVTVTEGPDLTEAVATCFYEPKVTQGMWEGLPVSSQEFAASEPAPEPSP